MYKILKLIFYDIFIIMRQQFTFERYQLELGGGGGQGTT